MLYNNCVHVVFLYSVKYFLKKFLKDLIVGGCMGACWALNNKT